MPWALHAGASILLRSSERERSVEVCGALVRVGHTEFIYGLAGSRWPGDAVASIIVEVHADFYKRSVLSSHTLMTC
jgi:hypothetical protein